MLNKKAAELPFRSLQWLPPPLVPDVNVENPFFPRPKEAKLSTATVATVDLKN
jgi:hypothetical protein